MQINADNTCNCADSCYNGYIINKESKKMVSVEIEGQEKVGHYGSDDFMAAMMVEIRSVFGNNACFFENKEKRNGNKRYGQIKDFNSKKQYCDTCITVKCY